MEASPASLAAKARYKESLTRFQEVVANSPTFKAESIADFLAKELKPRSMVMSPWLPEQGLAMLYAPRGVGKTFVALNVAYAVACGGEFLRWNAPHPRGVLYIDGEMPGIALQERLAEIVRAAPKEPTAVFKLMAQDSQEFGPPNLANPDHQDAIEQHLDGIELIVLDNISTLIRTTRAENDAESWIGVQAWMLRQRAKGRTVLLIHHAGKGGAQRGTSKREDTLDTVINLRNPPDYDPSEGARFEVRYEKSRGFHGDDAKPFLAEFTQNGWQQKDHEDSTVDQVIALLNDGLTQAEIARVLDLNRSTVSRAAKAAKEAGRIA